MCVGTTILSESTRDASLAAPRVWKLPDLWTPRTRPQVFAQPQTVSHSSHTHHRLLSRQERRRIPSGRRLIRPQILRRRPIRPSRGSNPGPKVPSREWSGLADSGRRRDSLSMSSEWAFAVTLEYGGGLARAPQTARERGPAPLQALDRRTADGGCPSKTRRAGATAGAGREVSPGCSPVCGPVRWRPQFSRVGTRSSPGSAKSTGFGQRERLSYNGTQGPQWPKKP